MRLIDRRAECGMLDKLVEAVRAGQGRALVLSGEPGVGKTALLEHLTHRAVECRVVHTAGVCTATTRYAGYTKCVLPEGHRGDHEDEEGVCWPDEDAIY